MASNQIKNTRYKATSGQTRWATEEEIKRSATKVDLHAASYPTAGIPVMSDGNTAYLDGTDTHTLIFGATGSKKTRTFCMPTINMMIRAGESFIVTDPKAELYVRTAGFAKERGYKLVVLNFRDIGYGDMWDPLALPFEYYTTGRKDEANNLINDLAATLAARQKENSTDLLYPLMAETLLTANMYLLFEAAAQEGAVNMRSLTALCSQSALESLKTLAGKMSSQNTIGMLFKGTLLGENEKTVGSIMSVLYGMVSIFNLNKRLTDMLCHNTFDMRMFGHEKTAVYIIVPDEKTTCHFLVTMFIKQVYEILIGEAQRQPTLSLPIRVNFVLDEFCNIPKVPDMPSMISAGRSRNMRFYLIVQSIHQLKGRYGEDADTIKGNCDNWIFLTSRERDLLSEMSFLCGDINAWGPAGPEKRPLISISELQRFNKQKGEVLILHGREYPFITYMADIDSYPDFANYKVVPIPPIEIPHVPTFDVIKFTTKNAFLPDGVPFNEPD
ncbi:MAG: type IV secretory system conjugative DNA transfer family protein [Lachnospiraceae bacterium]|nr:type IV secretory system conjugative DNA transfer family protein [Lachnospiraceae bacterium]